jgi:hypothetical protein
MAKREIVWTKTAEIQFFSVLEYWLNRNKSNSYPKKLIKVVTKHCATIAKNPKLYRESDFKDTRFTVIDNFSIYFEFNDEYIYITAFWDNRQNPEGLKDIINK